jgi:hypothetical protein
MDDIARDVAQRQAAQRQAHNEYFVHHEHLPLQVVRRFCTAAEDCSGRVDLERHGLEPWPESIVNSVPTDLRYLFDRYLSTIQNLTFVTQGPLLNVTFRTRFGAFNNGDEDEQWAPTTAQLHDLFSQMKRTYSWKGVRAIRLLRHDGDDDHDPDWDEFAVQIEFAVQNKKKNK